MSGFVSNQSATSGGWIPYNLSVANTTNATSLKATPGQIGILSLANINASPRYLHFYDKASAPTVGTDTPIATFIIPGNASGAGNNPPLGAGIEFKIGIAFAVTTSITAANSAVSSANEVNVMIGYK